MKVLMLGLTPPLEGGSERHIYELSKMDANIDVLTQKDSLCKNKVEIPILNMNRFTKGVTLVSFTLAVILLELLRIRKKYDIIHLHENLLYFLVPLVNIRFKTVVTVHGLKGFKFYDIKLLWRVQKFFLSFASIILAVGIEDEKLLKKEFQRVVYIPNGVDLTPYHKIHKKIEHKITFLGRIHQQKGIIFLLKAFKYLEKDFPSFKLNIIGEINNYARQLMDQFPSKNIIWRGYLSSREEIIKELKSSEVIVLPSLWEGLPLTLFEALASGRPVIVSDLPTIKSVVNHSNVFLFKSGSVKDLSLKLKQVLKNKLIADRIGKHGRKLAEKYDWSKLYLKLKSTYILLSK